ncbi:rodlin [Streptomyces sp. NPDC002405]|uniref:rodlin n=1 Tax=unclassified Streptomyces TaxID=2593676 RepID=UPI0036A45175
MLKRAEVAAAAAASVVGTPVAVAPAALAVGNGSGPTVSNGAGASTSFGDSATTGTTSPQFSLTQGALDKPCLGVGDTSAGVLQAVNVQDDAVLSGRQNQQCSDTSTRAKRDAALSHLLDNLSVLSANTGS